MRLSIGGHKCWIVVSLVPDLPGEFIIDQAALRTIRAELLKQADDDHADEPALDARQRRSAPPDG